MKVVILAGGFGSRLSEETRARPKPMVEVGGKPILWHIMKIYSSHGFHDFVICCGYRGDVIKRYFANYYQNRSDVTVDLRDNSVEVHKNGAIEPWKVTLADTGESTMTGGRLRRVRHYLGDEPFCMTYGDGVSDVDITKLVDFHREQGVLATLTSVQPPGRFGAFTLSSGQTRITSYREKPEGDGSWINGGFFVLDPGVIDYIEGDQTVWEQEPMKRLAREGNLAAYRHDGFWQPMDTIRDRMVLEELWGQSAPPWKKW